jgi:hypothetical protein
MIRRALNFLSSTPVAIAVFIVAIVAMAAIAVLP